MVNQNNTINIEELEKIKNTEISREAQLKIIDKIQAWKKENYETGDRLKKYQGNTYPAHITNNTTTERPLWRQLAGHVNYELNLVQYLDRKENPLDELLEMMLNSITRNVVGYYSSKGLEEKEREETKKYREKTNTLEQEIAKVQRERRAFERVSLDYLKELVDKKLEIKELNKELAEKELLIENQKKELKAKELEAETHLSAVKVCEDWYFTHHINPLNKEVANKSDLLQASEKIVKSQDTKIKKLEKESTESSELLKDAQKLIENQNALLQLYDKPLPNLPKIQTPSRFKIFKEKTKTKIQHLVEKTKQRSHELIARIEVKAK